MTDIARIETYFPRVGSGAPAEPSSPYAGLPIRDRLMVDLFHVGGIGLAVWFLLIR